VHTRHGPHHYGEVLHSVKLILAVNPGVRGCVNLILSLAATVALDIGEVEVGLASTQILRPDREAIAVAEQWSGVDLTHPRSPVVGDIVDDGKTKEVVEVLEVMLQVPFKRLSLAERRTCGEGGAQGIVVAGLIGEGGRRIALPGVALELLLGSNHQPRSLSPTSQYGCSSRW
jgi:hypothetical protein